jgi:peptidoglycan/xylan/chitin deacetylase (PgdA/CDA1 family)
VEDGIAELHSYREMTKKLLASAFALASGRFMLKRIAKPGIRIFFYHGVVERKRDRLLERNLHLISDFRDQVRLLKRANVVGLDDLRAELETSQQRPCVVITVDDGYRNNLILAEILAAYKLPWVLFVSTGLIGSNKTIWTVELSLLLLHGVATHVDACGNTWSLASTKEREAAFHAIRTYMKKMPSDMVTATMNLIRSQFPDEESQRLLKEYPSFEMLTWNDLISLAAGGVEIGSHGVQHHLHHKSQPRDTRMQELQVSRRQLMDQMGYACRAFSFPNGDFIFHSEEELVATGYEYGFTTHAAAVHGITNRYLLPRLHAPLSRYELAYTLYWPPE